MRKKINLWKSSVAFFFIVLLYALWFLYKKTLPSLIILLILIAVAGTFYWYCTKRITLPEGYTAVQAQRFYRSCIAAGLNSRRKMAENEALLQSVVKKHDFAGEMDADALWTLFCNGRAAEASAEKNDRVIILIK